MTTGAREPWLMLIHLLPPKPSSFRVKIWRRLQTLGAMPLKNSVYVLPNTEQSREDFEWVVRAITDGGGEASVCEARMVDGASDDDVRDAFRTAREHDYRTLAAEVKTFARGVMAGRRGTLSAERRAELDAGLERFQRRLDDVTRIDFFAAAGRETVEGLLRELASRREPGMRPPAPAGRRRRIDDVQGRTWVTRTGVHVDRIASAWLIVRRIDPAARFKFVPSRGYVAESAELRFDMFDAEFTHDGDLCTFEVLLRDFGVATPALSAVAEVVHDIDLKDGKFGRPEVPGIDHLIAGIAWNAPDDAARLAHGATVLDALHAYFERRRS